MATLPDTDLTVGNNLDIIENVLVMMSDATSGDMIISGNLTVSDATGTPQLQFPANTSRQISVAGDVSIAAGGNGIFDVAGSGVATHLITISGNLTNEGTIDFNQGGSTVDVVFDGSADQIVGGVTGLIDYHKIEVDKGMTAVPSVDLQHPGITFSGSSSDDTKIITLVNGTLRISANLGNITLSSGGITNRDFVIPVSTALILDNATTTLEMISSSGNLVLGGTLHMIDGTINIGDDMSGMTLNELVYNSAQSQFIMDGGVLNISGSFRPESTVEDFIDYSQTGGVVNVARYTNTKDLGGNVFNLNGDEADFLLTSNTPIGNSSFSMAGWCIACLAWWY